MNQTMAGAYSLEVSSPGIDRPLRTLEAVGRFTGSCKPFTVIGLLVTVVLLFGFQGPRILEQPVVILLIAIPLLVQSYGIFLISYAWAWIWQVPFSIAAPAALIGNPDNRWPSMCKT